MSVLVGFWIVALVVAVLYFVIHSRKAATGQKVLVDSDSHVSGAADPAPNSRARENAGFKKRGQAREKEMAANLEVQRLHQVDLPPDDWFGPKTPRINLITRNREGGLRLGLSGAEGRGKTATALHVIEELTPVFPQAQLYFNFDWVITPERAADEAMSHVIGSFFPDRKTPVTRDELTSQYRKALQDRKVILLFDNVSLLEDLRALLPPEGCLLIVTGPAQLKLDQMVWEEIEPLPREDTREMLTQLCGRLGFRVAEVGKYCGDNPLALNLAARFMKEFGSLDPEGFATKLRDQNKTLEQSGTDRQRLGIESILTLMLAVLREPLKILAVRLSLFPATFDNEAEAFICEDPENVKLGNLVRLGLVEFNSRSGRYHLPAPIRRWLKLRLTPGLQAQVEMRRATYYMTLLQSLHEKYQGGQAALRSQALQQFDRDWHNIHAGQAWVQSSGLKDANTVRICQGYTDFAYSLLQQRQPPELRLPWLEAGLLAAQSLQEAEAERDCLLHLGQEQLQLKRFGAAGESFEKARTLAEAGNDSLICLQALHGLGLAFQGEQVWDKALDRFMGERELAEQLGQGALQLRAEEALLQTCQQAGDIAQAMEWLEKALDTARQSGKGAAEGRLRVALGQMQLESGQVEEAVATLQNALSEVAGSSVKATQALMHRYLGDAYQMLKEPAKAVACYEQAGQLYTALRDGPGRAAALGQQGLCRVQAGEVPVGARLVVQACALLNKSKQPEEEIILLDQLGVLHLKAQRWQEAIQVYQELSERAGKSGLVLWQARASRSWGQALEGKGDRAEALVQFKSALKRFEKEQPSELAVLKEHILKLEKGVLQS